MAKWAIDDVALRFSQAADVARRLPAVRVQGYFNCWPKIKRGEHENLGTDDRPPLLSKISFHESCFGQHI